MRDTDIAWAAGIVDGEGCILMNGGVSWVPCLRLQMTHKPTLERFASIFGYEISLKKRQDKRWGKVQWSYVLTAAKAVEVLRLMLPYLLTKKVEADAVMEYAEKHKALGNCRNGAKAKLGLAYKEILQQLKRYEFTE